MEAQADRQRIKEEAERGLAVAMTNRDIDNVFPEDRFTLMSAEPDVLRECPYNLRTFWVERYLDSSVHVIDLCPSVYLSVHFE